MLKARFPLAAIGLLTVPLATINLLPTADPIAKAGADDQANTQSDQADLFKRLDVNGDGQIARDEVSNNHARLFGRLLQRGDANADGKLGLEEFISALAGEQPEAPPRTAGQDLAGRAKSQPAVPRRGGLLRVLDVDGDGKLSKEEIAASSESLRKLDRDNDGEVSRQELMAVFLPQPEQVPPTGAKRPEDNGRAAPLLERPSLGPPR